MTTGGTKSLPFWERDEIVAQFAAREPDHRLARLVDRFATPPRTRVLDLGCAGGRNTEFLARKGFDVVARDASAAMVAATRERLVPVLGSREAARRVEQGRMDDLGGIAAGSLDLIVALGIFQAAGSRQEWDRALAASSRVLARGGLLLVASHTDRFLPESGPLLPVPGEPHVFRGTESGPSFLVDAPTLDREMRRWGLVPWTPTVTVERSTEGGGRRATANALYRRT
jgi:16S rRNA (guanine1207-N2)-methyltransferase